MPTTTDIDIERFQETLHRRLPPYAVILHNDDHHSMDYVVEALMKSVPDLSAEAAIAIMLEAHNNGSAVAAVCALEQAELQCERLRGYGLGASVRKA